MKTPCRDLLVLTGRITMNQQEFDHQVELLNDLLYHVESLNAFCTANEVIDVNKHKVIQKKRIIQKIVKSSSLKPFIFISSKN